MRILITGICGFAGSSLARTLLDHFEGVRICGIDNFIRPGSETNRLPLSDLGIRIFHGDIRNASDLDPLPSVDFVIDAAANPSVLAGVDGMTSSRQLVEHNLLGTIHLLELCKRHGAGFLMLSTSRVYSIEALASIPVVVSEDAFVPDLHQSVPVPLGVSALGVSETFPTTAPVSLYGASKLSSEVMALEYGDAFGFPVHINRCGVLAGAGQFGRADQGIFSFWINSYLRRKPLRYIGFDGRGHQVRDCLHPSDLGALVAEQLRAGSVLGRQERVLNCSGGMGSAMSLRKLSEWCGRRFGGREIEGAGESRPFDIPWLVLDSTKAHDLWGWSPRKSTEEILIEISDHAEKHPQWLELGASR